MVIFKKIKYIFFDFDGVIKESVEIKTDAFEQLFLPFGIDIARKITQWYLTGGSDNFVL